MVNQHINGNDARWDSFDNFPDLITHYCQRHSETLNALAADGAVESAANLVWSTLSAGRSIFISGNGGSAANGTHFATDISLILSEGCNGRNRCCGSIHSLADSGPILSAIANDFGSDNCFAHQLAAAGQAGDLLIAVSVSGRSRNIVRACEMAMEKQMNIIGMFGSGGALESSATVSIAVTDVNYGRVEDIHLSLFHIITSFVRQQYRQKHSNLPLRDAQSIPLGDMTR